MKETVARTCSIEGCERRARRIGICQSHYERKRAGKLDWDGPIAEKQALGIQCIVPFCEERQWSKTVCTRHYRLRWTYGLSDEKIFEIYEEPFCKICGSADKSGSQWHHIDHDHSCCPSGSGCEKCVRGLLCSSCNSGLGHFRESPEILKKAIAYIEKHPRKNG